MTQSATPALPPLPRTPARIPRRSSSPRVIAALMQREMSTTYGRSALGYLWAVLEPVGGIMVITLVFTLAFRSPPVGTSFPLFFASGVLPFTAFMDTMTKVSSAIRFSRPLLFYPGVTFMDAILARVLMNVLTQTMISAIVWFDRALSASGRFRVSVARRPSHVTSRCSNEGVSMWAV